MKALLILAGALLLGGVLVYYLSSNEIDPARVEIKTTTPTTTKESTSSAMSFFITSRNPGNGADLGGLEGADRFCSTLAEEAGVQGKTWRAYLSTTATGSIGIAHARDRIGSGPWYNAKGELIARSIDELHGTNTLTKATAVTEVGGIVNGRGDTPNIHDILTGSNENGTASSTTLVDTTCSNWTSSTTGSAIVGHHDRVGRDDSLPMKSWNSSHLTRGCDMESLKSTGGGGLFYCFATE